MEKFKAKIAAMTTEQIILGVQLVSVKNPTPEQRIVRVHLLNEYETRLGGEAVDALMDLIEGVN